MLAHPRLAGTATFHIGNSSGKLRVFRKKSMLTLTPAQRRFLRAQAHSLHPVVMIGDAGLTEAIIKEAGRSVASHELIKIKCHSGDRAAREAQLAEICERLDAAPVQHIGKILVIYRPAEKPRLALP
jgi:RNA-binding protein